jgi:hypothetical protein
MRVGQVRKRDANEPAVVDALEAVGALVERLSGAGVADLLVCYHYRLLLIEVKNKQGRNRSTLAQETTKDAGWPVTTVWDPNGALLAIGALRG